jgi:DUF4097 and DUF4098 domain-containing protein YvlB
MRSNPLLLLLAAAALLLAESQPGLPDRRMEVRTSNGAVEITGSASAAESRTIIVGQNESVNLQVLPRTSLEVVTSNGAIRVSGVTGELHLRTSNGAIELRLPSGTNAKLSAHTSNGVIDSDILITATQKNANCLEGTIGSGGPLIELRTSNAAIHIRGESGDSHLESVTSVFTPGKP